MLVWPTLIVPWILVLWHPAELLQLSLLDHGCCLHFLQKATEAQLPWEAPQSHVYSCIFRHQPDSQFFIPESCSWICEMQSLGACLVNHLFKSGCWQPSVTNPHLYSWSWAELQAWLTAGKLRGTYLVEKKMLANENEKNVGKHYMSPAQKERAQVRAPQKWVKWQIKQLWQEKWK